MQIIHSDGLGNEDKRKDKKPLIADNIMQAILTLIQEMSFVQENQLHDNDELADAVARHSDSDGPIVSNKSDISIFDFLNFLLVQIGANIMPF